MAVALGNTSSGSANNATIDFVHTLGTGSNLVLVVTPALDADLTVSSVTWDHDGIAEALTQLASAARDNPGANHVDIWYKVGPGTATGLSEIRIVASAKGQNIGGAVTFTGATTPDNANGRTADGDSSPSSVTVTGPGADDFVIDCLRISTGTVLVVGANQTGFVNIQAGGERGVASTQDGTDGGVMDWTWVSATPDISHTACRIPEAAGAVEHLPPDLAHRPHHQSIMAH